MQLWRDRGYPHHPTLLGQRHSFGFYLLRDTMAAAAAAAGGLKASAEEAEWSSDDDYEFEDDVGISSEFCCVFAALCALEGWSWQETLPKYRGTGMNWRLNHLDSIHRSNRQLPFPPRNTSTRARAVIHG